MTADEAYNAPVFSTANLSTLAKARVSAPDQILPVVSALNQFGLVPMEIEPAVKEPEIFKAVPVQWIYSVDGLPALN